MNVSRLMNMLTYGRIDMKKLLITAMSVFVIGMGAGFAQTEVEVEAPEVDVEGGGLSVEIAPEEGVEFDTTQFVGISLPFPASIHYGLEDVQLFGASPDLRFRFSGNLLGTNIAFGTDVLFDIAQLDQNIQLYGGPSLELGTIFPVLPSFTFAGLVGGEYRFNRELGLYAELGTGISFPFIIAPRGSLGVNYHF